MTDAPRDALSRREFGQLLGAVALGGALPDMTFAESTPPPPAAATESSTADDLCNLTAVELAARIRRKQVSAREVMSAHLARIERVNPKVNAIVTLVADRAMADARKADELQARGGTLGPLHGLPGRAQGSRRHGRHPHDARLAVLPRPRADRTTR